MISRIHISRSFIGLLALLGALLLTPSLVVIQPASASPRVAAAAQTWVLHHPATSPLGRYVGEQMAYDPTTKQVVLFGGLEYSSPNELNNTWVWSGANWKKLNPTNEPSVRFNAAMAYDPQTKQLLLFGGTNGGGSYYNDTWEWTGTTWTQLHAAQSPSPRASASMAYDPATKSLVLFGGFSGGSTYLNDTWTWNGTTWKHVVPAASPSDRGWAAMAYDTSSAQMILFGGYTGAGNLADTWDWTGTTWRPITTAIHPSSRNAASIAYDAGTKSLILFGGYNSVHNQDLGDTWVWNGKRWFHLLPANAPSARDGAGLTWDSQLNEVVLFGGEVDTNNDADTWTWG